MLDISALDVYTGNSYTTCSPIDKNFQHLSCTTHLHTNPYTYVVENQEWKHYTEAQSLMNKGYFIEYLSNDKDFPIEVVDFNATSITARLSVSADLFGRDIPITYDNIVVTNLNFLSATPQEIILPISLTKDLDYGTATTTIRLSIGNITEDGHLKNESGSIDRENEDTIYVGTTGDGKVYRGYIEFNTSAIQSDWINITGMINLSVIGSNSAPNTYCNVTPIEQEVGLQSDLNLYLDIGNGTAYTNNLNCSYAASATWRNFSLGTTGNADLNESQETDKFAIGIKTQVEDDGEILNPFVYASESEYDPELIITYEIFSPPIFTFVSPTPNDATTLYDIDNFRINLTISEENLYTFIFDFNSTNHTIFNSSLRTMYNFDNRSLVGDNDTYAIDVTGNGANLDFNYDTNYSLGVFGNAINFDGWNDTADAVDTSFIPSGNNARTIEGWFYIRQFDTAADRILYSMQDFPLSANGRLLAVCAEDNATSIAYSGHRIITPKNGMQTNTWYHIALIVRSGATTTWQVEVWINGINQTMAQEAGSSRTLDTRTDYFTIGGYVLNQGGAFNGSVDEFKIWNRALTSQEINNSINLYRLTRTNATGWNYIYNATDMSYGTYYYSCWGQDNLGSIGTCGTRTLSLAELIAGLGPIVVGYHNINIPQIIINNRTNTTLEVGYNY